MRIGLMIGSDKERSRADRLTGLLDDGKTAERDGFASFWIPQVPGYLDAMTAVALLGQVTDRIEIGTAVVPIQTRHPLIMAQQALTTQVACSGRFTLGIGPSHHWIITDQLGLPYDKPALLVRDYIDVLDAAFAGSRSHRGGQQQLPGAQPGRRHRRTTACGCWWPHSDPRCCALQANAPAERSCGWPTSGRSVTTWSRASPTRRRGRAHRNPCRGRRARRALFEAARSTAPASTRARCSVTPTSPPTTSDCSSTAMPKTSGTPWRRATSQLSSRRLRSYRDAGVTDLAVRVVPLGQDARERSASRRRTQEFVASLVPEFASGA